LNIAIKNADLLVNSFGPDKIQEYPGHQIVELGLAKMYRITGKTEYLKLAKFFLDVRGPGGDAYNQADKKVVDQVEAEGHAVRAAYMYTGMADVAALTNDKAYLKAIDAIWNDVVLKKLYITGGIGAMASGEAFGSNYFLPNLTAYCETCAAVANDYSVGQVTGAAPLASPTFTGTVTIPTAAVTTFSGTPSFSGAAT